MLHNLGKTKSPPPRTCDPLCIQNSSGPKKTCPPASVGTGCLACSGNAGSSTTPGRGNCVGYQRGPSTCKQWNGVWCGTPSPPTPAPTPSPTPHTCNPACIYDSSKPQTCPPSLWPDGDGDKNGCYFCGDDHGRARCMLDGADQNSVFYTDRPKCAVIRGIWCGTPSPSPTPAPTPSPTQPPHTCDPSCKYDSSKPQTCPPELKNGCYFCGYVPGTAGDFRCAHVPYSPLGNMSSGRKTPNGTRMDEKLTILTTAAKGCDVLPGGAGIRAVTA